MAATAIADSGAVVAPDHQVVVIGAGFGGIGAGVRLKRKGIEDGRLRAAGPPPELVGGSA